MDLSLFFAGTAGSVPTPRRGLPALLLRAGGDRILLDCGEGTQQQLLRSVGLPELDAIFITHYHLDHWLGIVGMLKTFDLRARERPLNVYGPPGLKALFHNLKPLIGRTAYPLQITELEPHGEVRFGGYVIASFPVKHRVEAYGYAFIEDDRPGRFDVAAARALGVTEGPDFGRLQHGETVNGVRPEQVVGPGRHGRRIVYSGDTAPVQTVEVYAHGADVLVHEALWVPAVDRLVARVPNAATLKKHIIDSHTAAEDCGRVAAAAGVKTLVLSHLVPGDDPTITERMWVDAAKAHFGGEVILGKDLMEL
jgi:ribonuclease Z